MEMIVNYWHPVSYNHMQNEIKMNWINSNWWNIQIDEINKNSIELISGDGLRHKTMKPTSLVEIQ